MKTKSLRSGSSTTLATVQGHAAIIMVSDEQMNPLEDFRLNVKQMNDAMMCMNRFCKK